jgi:hypothetical protein
MHSSYSFYSLDHLWVSKDVMFNFKLSVSIFNPFSYNFILLWLEIFLRYVPELSLTFVKFRVIFEGTLTLLLNRCHVFAYASPNNYLNIQYTFWNSVWRGCNYRLSRCHISFLIFINNFNNFWSSSNNRGIWCYDPKRLYDNRLLKLFSIKLKAVNVVQFYFAVLWI